MFYLTETEDVNPIVSNDVSNVATSVQPNRAATGAASPADSSPPENIRRDAIRSSKMKFTHFKKKIADLIQSNRS